MGSSSGQSAVIGAAQLTASFAKLPPATAAPAPNPHRRPSFHRLPAGSFIGGFRTPDLLPGSIARARPASETLPVSGLRLRRGGRPRARDLAARDFGLVVCCTRSPLSANKLFLLTLSVKLGVYQRALARAAQAKNEWRLPNFRTSLANSPPDLLILLMRKPHMASPTGFEPVLPP